MTILDYLPVCSIFVSLFFLFDHIFIFTFLPSPFQPIPMNGDLACDGGYVNNIPVDVMKDVCGSTFVIAVDVENKDADALTNVLDWGDGIFPLYFFRFLFFFGRIKFSSFHFFLFFRRR
jgi:hypothetical protein